MDRRARRRRVAFATLGVALGAIVRDVRAASLLALFVSLPLVFLALVPSAAVSSGLFDAIRIISAIFPFKPALEALDAADQPVAAEPA